MTACGCSLPAGACPLYHILLLVRAPQLGCHVCTGSMYIYIHTHMCVCVCMCVCALVLVRTSTGLPINLIRGVAGIG